MSVFPNAASRLLNNACRLGIATLLGGTALPAFASTVHVTTPSDKVEKILPGQPAPIKCSVREAIINSIAGKVVAGQCEAPEPIGSLVPTTIVATNDAGYVTLKIVDELVISGGAYVKLQGFTIDANGEQRLTRPFRVSNALQPDPNTASRLELVEMTIVNAIELGSGGVAMVEAGTSLGVEKSHFANNKASIGGVFYFQGTGKITESQFETNFADEYGGVLAMGNTRVEAIENEFRDNAARLAGGVVYCKGADNAYGFMSYANRYLRNMASPTLKADAPFEEDVPENAPYLDPDADIALGGVMYMQNCTFLSNGDAVVDNTVVGKAAGYYSSNSSGEIRRGNISDNIVAGNDVVAEPGDFGGGGLYVIGGIQVLGSTVAGNRVINGNGGGMYFKSGTSAQIQLVANTTITENSAIGWLPSNQGPLPWGQGQPLSFPGLGSGVYFDDKVMIAAFLNNTVVNNTEALNQIAMNPPDNSSYAKGILFANNIVVNTTGNASISNCNPNTATRTAPYYMYSNAEWDPTKRSATCRATEFNVVSAAGFLPLTMTPGLKAIDVPNTTSKSIQSFYTPKANDPAFYAFGLKSICDMPAVNWLDQLDNVRPFGDSCVPGSIQAGAR